MAGERPVGMPKHISKRYFCSLCMAEDFDIAYPSGVRCLTCGFAQRLRDLIEVRAYAERPRL